MRMPSCVAGVAVFLVTSINVPSRALACVCSPGFISFKDAAPGAPLLVAARVVDGQPLERADAFVKGEIAAIDVEVIQVLRGREERTRFRVTMSLNEITRASGAEPPAHPPSRCALRRDDGLERDDQSERNGAGGEAPAE